MRNTITFFAFIIAGIVFCCAFACTTIDEIRSFIDNNILYKEYFAAIVSCGTFMTTCFAALFAVAEYQNHKKEQRIILLGKYNQRYSTDKNIQKVVRWMLKVAILNSEGDIVGADPYKSYSKPDIHEKEMFMRFFEELYLHIKNGGVEKRQACLFFSYYAIKFDEIKDYRLDISDYKSMEELENEKSEDQISKYWTSYRCFVEEMKIEWVKYTNELIKQI